ncbi:MAG: NAD(P)-dependent glycerol-3-phosphate dehydrogenase [Candidatus Omnitrophica bacterium]|nr:NAD(P)-dependent glycerol-3-phosphate dehydrogenase [Candidatus Omnitrophota bacterium]MBU4488374.1 NAD(P)-dependent glycerol-3-phosphate dehydrogenase [Candidatus Omnitrophota bacterium]MCG2705009.1 NAD(P)-dependent glycerol-3-phosphate dehydrogenase [Candidatus Omnitrophota bacterium]
MKKIAVVGDGGWGTALSIVLSQKGLSVSLWGVFKDYIESVAKTRENTKFLNGVKIPDRVRMTASLEDAIDNADAIILAIPSKYLRSVLENLKKIAPKEALYISVTKGIEGDTLLRMSETIKELLGKDIKVVAVSGPSIAIEVARGLPTTIVAASGEIKLAERARDLLMSATLRVYTSEDVVGVELGGSLKNIIAIAAGISDSLGFGTNTKAAILTRGLAEIMRLGVAMGARQETFAGLSGLGDLITTCISPYSRNRWFGEMLGKGKRADDIIKETEMVVEGVTTAKSAYELSKKYNIDMPLTREVYEVIYKNKSPKDVVKDLMLRSAKPEVY